MRKRTRNEYGGFLPLELNEGTEYYQYDKTKMHRYNCAKAAVSYVLEYVAPRMIYIPYYLCPNVCREVESHGIEVAYYHISENLMPCHVVDEDGICVYLVDYFGIMDEAITEYALQFKNATVIIDNSHSFYHQPIIKDNIYNIYSCKKFFGVPDGAYLIAMQLEGKDIELTYSAPHALYLLDCLERGTDYCYSAKKEVDLLIARNYGGMSVLAKRILESIDYEKKKEKRHSNFQQYQGAFNEINLLKCEDKSVPYIYPLYVGKNIKSQLVREKIYVPTLWGGMCLEEQYKDSFEYRLSDETIFLPVDQRYGEADIEFIIDRVKNMLS